MVLPFSDLLKNMTFEQLEQINIRTKELIDEENERIKIRENLDRFPIETIIYASTDKNDLYDHGCDNLLLDESQVNKFKYAGNNIKLTVSVNINGSVDITHINNIKLFENILI